MTKKVRPLLSLRVKSDKKGTSPFVLLSFQTTGLFYYAPGHINPQSMYDSMSENGLRLEYHKKEGNSKMKLRLQY